MKTLSELKVKYGIDRAHYEPNPNCNRCHGEGEYLSKKTGEMHFCICLFIEPSFSNEAASILGNFAQKELKKMKEFQTTALQQPIKEG